MSDNDLATDGSTTRLRVGVAVDNGLLPCWQRAVIDRLAAVPGLDVGTVVSGDARTRRRRSSSRRA